MNRHLVEYLAAAQSLEKVLHPWVLPILVGMRRTSWLLPFGSLLSL